jgi:DNA-binding PadR family transcriptional regulator
LTFANPRAILYVGNRHIRSNLNGKRQPDINLQNFLPLREPTFFILLSLANGRKHGYAIMKEVEGLSNGKIVLSNGTLYGALTRLLDQGLIERFSVDEPPESGRPRKVYRLSQDGRGVLNAEINRLENMLSRARVPATEEIP